jgi:hypothetical protein|tara:strand:+ start:153 stop:425 length:273 start_codon:yes stop_codon:yes gene_type:complete
MSANKLVHDYNYNLMSFGQSGFDYITSGTVSDQTFIAITALEDASISATASKGDSLSSVTIPKGLTIYGRFTSVTVSSGKILAYREATDL